MKKLLDLMAEFFSKKDNNDIDYFKLFHSELKNV